MAVWPAISRPDRLGLSEIDRLDVRAGDDDARERAGRARCTAERPFIDALRTFDVTQHPKRTRRQLVRKLIIMLAALALSGALAAPAQAADRQPPTIAIARPAANATYALNQSVTASYSCTDNRVVVSCVGTVANRSAIDTGTSGTKTFAVTARDRVGNTATKSVSYTVSSSTSDTVAPTITLTRPAANAAYALNQSVTASYSCADTGGSGVRSCMGTVANGVAIDTKTAGAHTFSVTATDNANNTQTTTVNYTVAADTTAPSITITTPAASATYTVGQDVKSAFTCADTGGSGVGTCSGTVANGSALNTSTQ